MVEYYNIGLVYKEWSLLNIGICMQVSKNQCYACLWFRKYLSSKCKCNWGTYNSCNCIKPLPHLCTCEYITLNINCISMYNHVISFGVV